MVALVVAVVMVVIANKLFAHPFGNSYHFRPERHNISRLPSLCYATGLVVVVVVVAIVHPLHLGHGSYAHPTVHPSNPYVRPYI